ncbi:GMC family oxidoreductase N-terminal domain-containing protein [Celeribacter baekdonensis]|uniref:GMC family oxidoreductase n=1 Tax=Celeribacter baekdonensis TaxID=875171 RepID=UPI0026F260C9|nr:GMC family oxidoreductase N-terminal domain-containing protein [Celeribacter baekdonensis]|tara:strand:+ start:3324 stop:4901 length:1578 start_codon:yes stop_codon:yes gene_type:complete
MFDYIIVGAGSAGCVLANRLSDDPSKRVCLIEAGGKDRSPFIHVPLGLAVLARLKGYNWNDHTAPDPNLNHRRLFWPRGRVLGGSSSINAMIYMRGHPEDYRAWARAAGAAWDWPRAFELFKRLEGNAQISDAYHGVDGPLSVSDLRSPNPLSHAFVRAGVEAGLTERRDFNGVDQEGVGLFQVTQKDGKRFSAARAFLAPVRGRANLTILTGEQVTRVMFKGVETHGVALRDREIVLNPGGEVILSAGAIKSPHLLMLSGIGPGEMLRAQGIEVRHNAPEVGENLADHLDITVMSAARNRLPIGIAPTYLPRALRAAWDFGRKRRGELTSNVAEAGGFVRSGPDQPRPNLQFHFIPAYLRDHGRKTSFGYGMTLHVCDLLPKSRGRITLASSDPRAAPVIDAGYLSHPEDVATLLSGLKIARSVMAAPALACHVASEVLPGASLQSDEALIKDIRARSETIYHPVGTCRMGMDAGSVVDAQAQVRGVSGLRVVDASIMPQIIAGNTNAPTMMIAENVADMMLRP